MIIAQSIGYAVLYSFGQIAAIWLIYKGLTYLFSRHTGAQYLLAMTALGASALLFFLTIRGKYTALAFEARQTVYAEDFIAQIIPGLEIYQPAVEVRPADSIPALVYRTKNYLESWSVFLGGLWCVGAAWMWLRLAGGFYALRRIRVKGAEPAAAPYRELLDDCMRVMHMRRNVELLSSTRVNEPVSFGFWKPVILFPAGLWLQLTPGQLESLLIHELEHIRRWDYFWNTLQLALDAIFFYHPLFRLISKDARTFREYACDDAVLRHTSEPLLYAQTLTSLKQSLYHFQNQFVMNALGKNSFSKRILRIAGFQPETSIRIGMTSLILPALTGAFCALAFTPEKGTLPALQPPSFEIQMPAANARGASPIAVKSAEKLVPETAGAVLRDSRPNFQQILLLEYQSRTSGAKSDSMPPAQPAIDPVKLNVLYVGVDNPLNIAVPGYRCDDLEVKMEGGTIAQTGACLYSAKPSGQGKAYIVIYDKKGNFLGKKAFRSKLIPDPTPTMNMKASGKASVDEILTAGSISPWLTNFEFDIECEIVGYELTVLPYRADPITFNNVGAKFNASAVELIKTLAPGSAVFFDNIQAKCPGDQSTRSLGGLAFKIKAEE